MKDEMKKYLKFKGQKVGWYDNVLDYEVIMVDEKSSIVELEYVDDNNGDPAMFRKSLWIDMNDFKSWDRNNKLKDILNEKRR